MNATNRIVLVALVFALIASSLLTVDADAKRKRKHRNRENRTGIVRVAPDAQVPDASFAQIDPILQVLQLDPILQIPELGPCGSAAAALNGVLPQTVTPKKTDTYWAKLTLAPGLSVLACDLSNESFAIRFDDVTLKQYGKASAGGVSVSGWNFIASLSGSYGLGST